MTNLASNPNPVIEPDAWLRPDELRTLVPPQNAAKLDALVSSMGAGGWSGRPILVVGSQAWTGPHRIAAAAKTNVDVPVVRIAEERVAAIDERVAAHGGPRLASILDLSDRIRFFQVATRLTGDADFARATALLQLEERTEWLDDANRGITPSSLPDASQLVYAIGRIGFDFGTPARLDDFRRRAGNDVRDPGRLLAFLNENPADAADMIWTIDQDGVPLYAVEPRAAFADRTCALLRELLASRAICGLPGCLGGTKRLANGMTVPCVAIARRGVEKAGALATRIIELSRNRGLAARDRAVNFVAAHAHELSAVEGLEIESIVAARSPLCRPESECVDVRLTFFDPANRLARPRRIVIVSVDVADEVPAFLGGAKSWETFA